MKSNVVLINGVSIPYHVFDTCVKQKNETDSSLSVIIAFENKPTKKESTRARKPSIVAFTNRWAHTHLTSLIENNAAFTTEYFRRQGMDVKVNILRNPSLEDIEAAVSDADNIFLDPKTYRQPLDAVNLSFAYKLLEDKFGDRIKPCAS